MLPLILNQGSPVNTAHPFNRGLVAAWMTRAAESGVSGYGSTKLRALVGNHHAALSGTPVWAGAALPGTCGKLTFDDVADYVNCGNVDTLFPVATDCTILIWHRKRSASLLASTAFGTLADTGVNRVGCHLPYSDGNVYFDYGGASSGLTRISVAITADTNWHLWAFTIGGGLGMRIYRDAVLLTSNAATPSRDLTSGTSWLLNSGNGLGAGSGDLADIRSCHVYSRAMTADQISAWMQESRLGHPDTLNWIPSRAMVAFAGAAGGGTGPTTVGIGTIGRTRTHAA